MDDLDLGATIKGFMPGQKVFGRYTLKKILGRGGMGVVWLARDEELEREVALKFLPEVIMGDRGALEELKRETRRNLALTHPHIVRIHDFVQDARTAAISMEYVEGDTLANLRLEQPEQHFEAETLRRWVGQLGEALSYAHEKAKVVHRDLKPANLMVDAHGDLKVTDFGIARSLSDSVSRVSQQGGSSGTPVYMSPQQMMGEKAAAADDIYALGATLYELLTGKPPFYSGNVFMQVQQKVPPTIAARREELEVKGGPVPAAWEETIAACLAKAPQDRPASIRAVVARLEGSSQATQGGVAAPAKTQAGGKVGPGAATPTAMPGKSKAGWLAAVIIGLGMLIPAGYYFGIHQPEQERLALEEARRLETVRLESERLEHERNEAKAKAERERIAAEQEAERQRLAAEREREREAAMAAHPWRMIELYLREGRTLWEVPAIAEAGAVATALREYEQAKATLTRLPERYRSKHPRIIEAVAAVEDAGRAMWAAARDAADRQRLDYGLKFNQGQAPGWEGLALVGPENWLADFRQQLAQMDEVVSGVADQPKIPVVGQPWTMPDLVLRLMPIPAGSFLMGSAQGGDNNERPLTRVTISRPYWLGQTEVTQAQWHMLMGSDPAGFPGDLRPVETVSWKDAMEFCQSLTERERAAGRLPEGYVYTLPTEAQWEYAARAGTTGDHAGNLEAMAWHSGNSGGSTQPVGLKEPNAWGLHDMHGNVWEHCLDRFGPYPGGSVTDPAGPRESDVDDSMRVVRGGSWQTPGTHARSAHRFLGEMDASARSIGFRVALAPVMATSPAEANRSADAAIQPALAAAGLVETRRDEPVAQTTGSAKLVFFRPAKLGSALAGLKIERIPDGRIGDLSNGSWFEREVPAGPLKLRVTHTLMRDKAEVEFVFQAGRTYYIRCLPEGSMSTMPEISLVGEIDGQHAVARLKKKS